MQLSKFLIRLNHTWNLTFKNFNQRFSIFKNECRLMINLSMLLNLSTKLSRKIIHKGRNLELFFKKLMTKSQILLLKNEKQNFRKSVVLPIRRSQRSKSWIRSNQSLKIALRVKLDLKVQEGNPNNPKKRKFNINQT